MRISTEQFADELQRCTSVEEVNEAYFRFFRYLNSAYFDYRLTHDEYIAQTDETEALVEARKAELRQAP